VAVRRRRADRPGGDLTFWSSSAFSTSVAAKPLSASFFGSSQMRIAYLRSPKMMTSETP
jgi:hypothetical protein